VGSQKSVESTRNRSVVWCVVGEVWVGHAAVRARGRGTRTSDVTWRDALWLYNKVLLHNVGCGSTTYWSNRYFRELSPPRLRRGTRSEEVPKLGLLLLR